MAGNLITLKSGPALCQFRLDLGAGIAALRLKDQAILREAPTDASSPRQLGCFVMAPWVNRIADGRFSFFGKDITLPTDDFAAPHAIHGQAWSKPWVLQDHAEDRVIMAYDGGENAWPWRYRVTQVAVLTPDRFDLVVMLMNRTMEVMPAALGLHPYFPAGPDWPVRFSAKQVFTPGADQLPASPADIPAALDFSKPRAALNLGVDHGFGGWDGTAEIGPIRLRAQGCDYLQMYAPKDKPYLCIEPQTAPANAPHLPGSPWGMLLPYATMTIGMTLSLAP